jgi:dinuclear metal center YbgI/SA1388 family protein
MTVYDFYLLMDQIAPFDTQAEFDNSGLLVGSPSAEVSAVLLALDVTEAVIDEAVALGAQLIITHHPLMFSARRQMTDEDYEGRLIRRLVREDISLIAAHTNLDQAPCGINDTLAELCGLTEITGEGFFRSGLLPEAMTAAACAEELGRRLGTVVRLMGPEDAVIRRIGLCSGGGSDEWASAVRTGCDAFLSGEIKHHLALALADRGIVAFECGHFATEEPGMEVLAVALQKALPALECNVRVYVSEVPAYAFPR